MPTVPLPRATSQMAGLDPLILAGTVCARLCHDLAGSLGAMTGTLEVAAEAGDREALELAIALAKEVGARLRLLRAAWGAGSEVPSPDTLCAGLPGAERLRVDTTALRAEEPETLRLALCLLLVAASGLPRGGAIALSGTDQALCLEIDGTRAAWPAPLAACLTDEDALRAAAETPRSAAVAMACLQAQAIGRCIVLDSPTRLSVKQQ